MPDFTVTFVDRYQLKDQGEEQAFPVRIDKRCLAQGDSRFSIGALPPARMAGNPSPTASRAGSIPWFHCGTVA